MTSHTVIYFNSLFYNLWKYFPERSANLINPVMRGFRFFPSSYNTKNRLLYSGFLHTSKYFAKSCKRTWQTRLVSNSISSLSTIERATSRSIISARNGIPSTGCLIDAGKKRRRIDRRTHGVDRRHGSSPPRRCQSRQVRGSSAKNSKLNGTCSKNTIETCTSVGRSRIGYVRIVRSRSFASPRPARAL